MIWILFENGLNERNGGQDHKEQDRLRVVTTVMVTPGPMQDPGKS